MRTWGVLVIDTGTLFNLDIIRGAAAHIFALGVKSFNLRALLPNSEEKDNEIDEIDTDILRIESLSSQTGTSTERMENLLKPRYFFGFFTAAFGKNP